MLMRGLIVSLVTLTAAFAGLGCSDSGQQAGGGATTGTGGGTAGQNTGGNTLVVKGSDTMLQLSQAWAEAFMKKHPDISVSVTGGGSGTGIKALINGTTQIANASREIETKEVQAAETKGIKPVQHAVARDALSLIVHPSNTIESLSIDQIKAIYTGKVTNWKEVGGPDKPFLLLSRETNSGTYGYFKEHLLDDENFIPTTLLLPSTKAITDEVATNPRAIGYVGLGYVSDTVKPLKIKATETGPAVDATMDNVLNKTYPISRELYQYTNGEPTGHAKTWMDYVLSPEGQQIVRQKDYVPIK